VPFQKGQSGNPAGRQLGSRNRTTEMVEQLLEAEATAISRKVIDLALEGNPAMLKLCLERIAPVRKGRSVPLPLGSIKSASDRAAAQALIVEAMAESRIAPEEAAAAAKVLDAAGAAFEAADHESRIAALEEKLKKR
jgi:septal ring-binding cell division protein DamX